MWSVRAGTSKSPRNTPRLCWIWKRRAPTACSASCPGVFQFTSAVATGTSKALAGQLSPQEALDEVAAEWEKILKRVGKDNVREAYAVGVALEDNLN